MLHKVKICGLSTPATLEAALDARACMVGLVLVEASPRHVSLDAAAGLAAQARGRTAVVALVVDADDDALRLIVDALRPDWLQLHGRETPERTAAIRARFGLPVMKAVGVSRRDDLARASHYAGAADRLLLDAKPPSDAALPGGNGQRFDWRLLAGLDLPLPFMLSGGLTPGNVVEAVGIARPTAGVDVSSGVESAPGVKDASAIRAFIDAAREVAGSRPDQPESFRR